MSAELDVRITVLETTVAALRARVYETRAEREQRETREQRAADEERAAQLQAFDVQRDAERIAQRRANLDTQIATMTEWCDLLGEFKTQSEARLAVLADAFGPGASDERSTVTSALEDCWLGYTHTSCSPYLPQFLAEKGVKPMPGAATVTEGRPGLQRGLRELAALKAERAAIG